MLPHVAFDGWSATALTAAAADAGIDPDVARIAFPDGAAGMVDAYTALADIQMAEALIAAGVLQLKVRERITLAVRTYLEPMSDGRSYGEGLLEPSVIYVNFVRAARAAGVELRYLAHVTGHGWRKLMRLAEPFVYEIDVVREPLPVFRFLEEKGPIETREMYATFNMGVGFAAYVPAEQAESCVAAARAAGYDAWRAGTVRKQGDRRAVEVPSLGITFEAETLALR